MSDFNPAEQIAEITNLVARIAHRVDYGTLEEYAALLAEDFVWEFPGNPNSTIPPSIVQGRDANLAGSRERRAQGTQGPGSHTRHIISSTAVEPHPEAPKAATYLAFYGNTHEAPVLKMMGIWQDEYRRNDAGAWVLAHRRVIID